jgi:ankyrin repeat protein
MFPVPAPGNLAPAPVPVPIQAPAQPPGNPAPQVNNVVVPDDPRGSKRGRENDPQDYDEPVLKQARTEPAAEQVDPTQQKLIDAIENGDVEGTRRVIRSFPAMLNSHLPGVVGFTPLCLAAYRGQLEVATALLCAGALIDAPSRRGNTPLMFAAEIGDTKLINLFCSLEANLHAKNKVCGRDALSFAIVGRQLEAGKLLIAKGADINRKLELHPVGKSQPTLGSPLSFVMSCDYSEILAWLLDNQMLLVDSLEVATQDCLLNCAARHGSVAVLNLLLDRGASLDNKVMKTVDGKVLCGVWEIASFFTNLGVIECLLSRGYRPRPGGSCIPDFARKLGIGGCTDLCIHLIRQDNGRTAVDGLKEDEFRRFPEKIIEGLVQSVPGFSTSNLYQAVDWWVRKGLLSAFLNRNLNENFLASARILGKNEYFVRPFDMPDQAVPAQHLQILIELLSNRICASIFFQLFSVAKLTPKGTEKMNQIAAAQGELLLKGIARLRERFAQQVATLPGICIDTYISVSHQLNEADLYRKMTMEWGLYDPVTRAALRLVKKAYKKLGELSGKQVPAEFAALSLSEQLRHVMVDMLEEWDKVQEIVGAILESGKDKDADDVPELLFQQWRLFCEAFGVIKPREFAPSVTFGPHKLEGADEQATMDVDVAPVVKATKPPAPLPPQ